MGGAMLEGWRRADAFPAEDLIIWEPFPGPAPLAAEAAGAQLNPPESALAKARTVLLCVKPQTWVDTAAEVAAWLHADAVIVSVAAGVRTAALAKEFGGRRVARVMPTTAAAIGQATTSVFSDDPEARARAHSLFAPVGAVVDLADEELMHAATAVSGSSPAYLYAFIEALEAAGISAGLAPDAASRLARSTITGAAALLAEGGEDPAALRRQVTSPGGTTEAALEVLMGQGGFETLLREAVAAAVRRSKALGA
jgi:pyrroline-5-carboxylate reductase